MRYLLIPILLLGLVLQVDGASRRALLLATTEKGGGAAGCTTAHDSHEDAIQTQAQFGNTSSRMWIASHVVWSDTDDVCRVEFDLNKIGSPSGNITAYLYNYDSGGDQPSTVIATGDTIALSSVSSGWVSFDITVTPSGSGVTNMWVLAMDTIGDGSNNMEWDLSNSSGWQVKVDDDGTGTWSLANNNRRGRWRAFKN